MFRNIRWRIAVPYIVVTLATLLGVTLLVTQRARTEHLADLGHDPAQTEIGSHHVLAGDAPQLVLQVAVVVRQQIS